MKSLIKIAIALAVATGTSFAATSGNITISGTVAANTAITVTPQAGYNSLDLASGGTDLVVASVNEKCNSRTGYTVTLASANAGTTAQATLKGAASGNTDVVNYSLKYDGAAVTLASGTAVVTNSSTRTASTGTTKNLAVSFAASWVNTDTYSDTLTLTITAQ